MPYLLSLRTTAVVGVGAQLVPASSERRVCPPQRVRAKLKRGPRFLPAQRESKFGPEAPAIPTNGDKYPQTATSDERGVPAETA